MVKNIQVQLVPKSQAPSVVQTHILNAQRDSKGIRWQDIDFAKKSFKITF